jgi:hypothetical protein
MRVFLLVCLCATASANAQENKPLQAEPTAVSAVEKPVAPPSNPETEAEAPRQRKPAQADRLDLDTTVVTGNRELPKVLYIVPWKKAEIGDLPAQPFNTLLDEVLAPVDRDVFKREVRYFHTVTSSGANTTAPSSGAQTASPPPTR